MKTLPKYYVIKQDRSDPRWKRYIEWLNSTYDQSWRGLLYPFFGFDGSSGNRGTDAWGRIEDFENNPTLITLDDWEEATQKNTLMSDDTIKEIESFEAYCNSKPQRKRHTYATTYNREDGVSFTADSIDGKQIDDLEAEEKEHYAQARAIRALLNAHRNLKF